MTSMGRKKLHIAVTLIFVIAILLTGTFAWSSINQTARNEMSFLKAKEYGSLEIEKIVENSDESELNSLQKSLSFTFTVTFDNEGSYDYTIGEGRTKTLKSGETLQLCHGETAVFEEIPVGVLYNVTETPVEGYTVSSNGHRGNITKEGVKAEFTNTCELDQMGHLTVSKEVRGAEGELKEDTEFSFKITLDGDVEHSFQLKHGDEMELRGLPIGTTYVVEEELEDDRFTALVEKYKGQIRSPEEVELPFINYYHEEPPTEQDGQLEITKIIDEENPDTEEVFTFNVSFTDSDFDNPGETFELKHGETCPPISAPHGVTYTVRETETNGYWPEIDEIQGKIVGGETAEITYINKKPDDGTGRLTISKEVRGMDANREKDFHFELEIDGEKTSFTLSHNAGSKQFGGLRPGSTYTVTETDASEDGYTAAVESYSGIVAGDESILLPFINVHESEPQEETGSLQISKEVVGLHPDPEQEFTFEIELEGEDVPEIEPFHLKDGESTLIENLPIGAKYKITETDTEGYEAVVGEVTGFIATSETIAVSMVNQATSQPKYYVNLNVEKVLKGSYPEDETEREFKMELLYGGETKEFSLKGGDSETFQIPEGAYYEIREENYEAQRFRQSIENGAGTATGQDIDVIVTNTYTGQVKKEVKGDPPIITKVVKGEDAPKMTFQFAFVGEPGSPMPEDSENAMKVVTLEGEGSVEVGEILFTKSGTYNYRIYEIKEDIKGWTFDTARYTVTFEVKEEDGKLTCKQSITKGGQKTDEVSFVNTFDKETLGGNVVISGKKTWDHGDNPEEEQPASIVISLYADGKLASQRQVTEDDDWKYSFEVPSETEEGEKIVYTIDEEKVANYKKSIDGYDVKNVYVAPEEDEPTTPDKPAQPDEPEQPDESEKPDEPEDTPADSDKPENQKQPESSDKATEPETSQGGTGEGADTGDHSYLGLWMLILIQSICVLIIIIYEKKCALLEEGGPKNDK